MPYVIYKNTDNNEAITVGDTKTTVAITREGGFSRSTMDIVERLKYSRGQKTGSHLTRLTVSSSTVPISCNIFLLILRYNYYSPSNFDLIYYSINQVCFIHLVLMDFDRETVLLIPDNIIMDSKTELTQYFIKAWSLMFFNTSKTNIHMPPGYIYHSFLENRDEGLKMEIVFKRRLTNEILTTYLPTILLFLIVFATTKFKSFYFEAVVTVNLARYNICLWLLNI